MKNSYLADGSNALPWPVLLYDGIGTGSAKHDQVKERVGPQAVGTVYTSACSLAGSIQTWNNLITHLLSVANHLKGNQSRWFALDTSWLTTLLGR